MSAQAASIEGVYTVAEGCKPNNSRLTVLGLMFSEGIDVVIETNQAESLLAFSADHNSLALPLSSETELKSEFFEDYYSNADIRATQHSYSLKTQGSEWGLCGHHPLPGKLTMQKALAC